MTELTDTTRAGIGLRLKITREAFGLTAADLAKRRPKLYEQLINNYERGRREPRRDLAREYVDEFGVSLDWIYLGSRKNLPYEIVRLINDRSTGVEPGAAAEDGSA